MLPEMAHSTLRAHQDELRSQWQSDWENWQAVGQWRAIVAGGGQHLDLDSQDSGASADGSGYSLNIGGSYRLNDAWRVGVAAGFYRQDMEAGHNDSDYKLNSYLATAFAQFQQKSLVGRCGTDRRQARLRQPGAQVRPGRQRSAGERRHGRSSMGIQHAGGLRHRPAGQRVAPLAVYQR
nr:hypothetical protein GCM10020185_41730 [Pseudomonas brassicacearum subsp. brassicacearum]